MRVYAFEETTYGKKPNRKTIAEGEVIELPDEQAKKLVASHSDTLMLLADGEDIPGEAVLEEGDYETTVIIRPNFDRRMIPGRLSQQKKRQLMNAKRRSPHKARMMIAKE